MPTHADCCTLPYTQEQLFNLVADVEKYHEFLPWCQKLEVIKRENNEVIAVVTVGAGFFSETYTCKVQLTPYQRIDVRYLEGPFKHLNNHWQFNPKSDGSTEIDFFIDFDFHSGFFQKAFEMIFKEAVHHLMSAFTNRAKELYTDKK
jgi:coenzyme Q-binding protein COQ10